MKRTQQELELSVGEPMLLATDVEADVTDGLSVGEPGSSRLGEVKRNPTNRYLIKPEVGSGCGSGCNGWVVGGGTDLW